MRVAAINWELRPIASESDFIGHACALLDQAKSGGAELAVFPEFFTLELLSLFPEFSVKGMDRLIEVSSLRPIMQHAQTLSIACVAGSTFYARNGEIVNASLAQWPDGRTQIQTKNVLTQFEGMEWELSPGAGAALLPDPRFGINICYDSEFPAASRDLAEHGMLCLCVPAYTETQHGFHRVRTCCQARAIELQIFVVHSSLVGSMGREPVPRAVGSSAILAPCVPPFPESGVLAETIPNQEGIAIAELDFEALLQARREGDVRNWDDRNKGDWTIQS